MDTQEQPTQPTSFKFPFTDNEETVLNLSESLHEFGGAKTPLRTASQSEDGSANYIYSPSDLSLGLSPIAMSRDSDASMISCTRSLGEEADADTVDRTNVGQKNKQQKSIAGDDVNGARGNNLDPASLETNQISPVSDHSSSSITGDLQSAMKQVGERSSNFIDKIRNAAHKRKVAVTRSRDSLVAKEQEQLRSIAESKTRLISLNEELQTLDEKNEEATKENANRMSNSKPKHSFKNNRSSGGFSGLGVPKVEKRPTTVPLSPMLGSRRKGGGTTGRVVENSNRLSSGRGSKKGQIAKTRNRKKSSNTITKEVTASVHQDMTARNKMRDSVIRSTNSSKLKVEEEVSIGSSTLVKARLTPSPTTRRGNAGQIGVPKVSKRAVTVPISPCLGPKRQSRIMRKYDDETHSDSRRSKVKINPSRTRGLSVVTQSKIMSPSSIKGSPLLGLKLIDSTQGDKSTSTEIYSELTPKSASFKPFVPRSTTRANMRRDYDILRNENREIRLLEERERLQSQIKVIHRELKILSKDLT
mmetsp:Transcript_1147/g.2640  ORF Transcript_1147/g.2640 Transcript_1147/m.2640 type:complete len:530 (-) Transcript_1147:627-2216(-)